MFMPVAELTGPASYIGWGIFTISIPNLIMVSLLVGLFVLALVLPFPGGKGDEAGDQQ